MKVHVIGGGPAGLYFSILMKKAWPQTRITVFERNRPDDTFGFGVVFSDQTLDTFESYDRESYRAIIGHFAYWDDIEIHFRGTTHRIGGNGFCGCSRGTLLKILGRRARSLGVEIKYQSEVSTARPGDPRRRSRGGGGRHQFAHARRLCRPVQAERRSAAELLLLDGLDAAVRCLHVLLPRDRARHLHRPLLPVRAAALDLDHRDRSARRSRAPASTSSTRRHRRDFVEGLFAEELQGHRLITNRSIWRNFPTIRCERWVADNMVLIGDAKATAHFSIGSGTKLAMEDAIALYEAFRATGGRDVKPPRWRTSSRGGATRSRRRSTPPTCRWSGSSTSSASGTWTRRASRSA